MKRIFSLFSVAFALFLAVTFAFPHATSIKTVKADYLEYSFSAENFTDETGSAYNDQLFTAQTEQINALLTRAEQLFDPQNPQSDVARINAAAAGESVVIDPLTLRLFLAAKSAYEATNGAFNPALYPLTKLWGFSSDNAQNYRTPRPEPASEQIQTLLAFTDFSLVQIDQIACTVTKPQTEMQFDFGGIAKGFLLDELAATFPANANALLTIMSSSMLLGSKYDGSSFRPYKMAVTDPRSVQNVPLILSAQNAFLSTSGDYERYYIYQNQRYSHVLNAKTGKPAACAVMSATAVASSGALSDALSTALCTLSLSEGETLIRSLGASALLICENYEYYIFGDLSVEEGNRISPLYGCPYQKGTTLPETIIPYVPQKSNAKTWITIGVIALALLAAGVAFYKGKTK